MRIVILGAAICLAALPSLAQQGHEDHWLYHDDAYGRWNIPGSVVSCCNVRRSIGIGDNAELVGDCYPTEFRLGKDGWEALLDPRTNNGRRVFVVLPEDRQLHEKNPDPSGVAGHLCENYAHDILCWVPPTGAL